MNAVDIMKVEVIPSYDNVSIFLWIKLAVFQKLDQYICAIGGRISGLYLG